MIGLNLALSKRMAKIAAKKEFLIVCKHNLKIYEVPKKLSPEAIYMRSKWRC